MTSRTTAPSVPVPIDMMKSILTCLLDYAGAPDNDVLLLSDPTPGVTTLGDLINEVDHAISTAPVIIQRVKR